MKKLKILLIPVVVIALLCAALVAYSAFAVYTSLCVIRVEYNGLNNIGRIPNHYYALGDNGALRVPGIAARLFLGDDIRDAIDFDDDTSHWTAELWYSPDGEVYLSLLDSPGVPYIHTAHGDNYRLYYNTVPSVRNIEPDERDLAMMKKAAEELHDGDPDNWSASEKDGGRLLLFMQLARKDDAYFIIVSEGATNRILMPEADGTYTELYEVPKGGVLSYMLIR